METSLIMDVEYNYTNWELWSITSNNNRSSMYCMNPKKKGSNIFEASCTIYKVQIILVVTIIIPLAPLSHFQVGVKSVPHWLQLNGTGWMLFSLSSFSILLTHSSRPNKQMNSVFVGLGMKCISGGGGLGGGIWKRRRKQMSKSCTSFSRKISKDILEAMFFLTASSMLALQQPVFGLGFPYPFWVSWTPRWV